MDPARNARTTRQDAQRRPRRRQTRRTYLTRIGAVGGTATLATLSGCLGGLNLSGDETTLSPDVDADAVVDVGPAGNQYGFAPGTEKPLRVSKGATVAWLWKSNDHNVVVGNQPDGANWTGTEGAPATVYNAGYQYVHTFEVPGRYHYWCQPHKRMGMVADLVVEE